MSESTLAICTVRASASPGVEIALDDTLCFDIACSNHLMVSPPLRGSNPYPCGSLTYRILHDYCRACRGVCQHGTGIFTVFVLAGDPLPPLYAPAAMPKAAAGSAALESAGFARAGRASATRSSATAINTTPLTDLPEIAGDFGRQISKEGFFALVDRLPAAKKPPPATYTPPRTILSRCASAPDTPR